MLKFFLSSCSHKEEILIYNSVTILWNEQKLNAKTQNNYKVYPHLSHSFIKINIKNSHFQKKNSTCSTTYSCSTCSQLTQQQMTKLAFWNQYIQEINILERSRKQYFLLKFYLHQLNTWRILIGPFRATLFYSTFNQM